MALEVTISGTGETDSVQVTGDFNVSLNDFGVATVYLERSFDGGSTWFRGEGQKFEEDYDGVAKNGESDCLARFNCTAYTSGTLRGRIGE